MVKIKRTNKKLKTVSFDEEIVTKDGANKLLSKTTESKINNIDELKLEKESSKKGLKDNSSQFVGINRKTKRKKSNKQEVENENNNESKELHSEIKVKRIKIKLETNKKQNLNDRPSAENKNEDLKKSEEKKIKRKKKKGNEAEVTEQPEETDEVTVENPKVKTGESVRAQKRKKHAQLLEEKHLKAEVVTQQNVLNYLSKWKHCRNEWKFEKLKQIWLQQNLFDTSKIPNEFWETAVEYFNGSKGFIRNVVLRDALKIIEKEESTEEENTDENYLLILNRARDIVQHLQE